MSESDTLRRRKVKREITVIVEGNFREVEGWTKSYFIPRFGTVEFMVTQSESADPTTGVLMFSITETLSGKAMGVEFPSREEAFAYLDRICSDTSASAERLRLLLGALRSAHIAAGFVTPRYSACKQTYYKHGDTVVSSRVAHVRGTVLRNDVGALIVVSADARRHLGTTHEKFSIVSDTRHGLGVWITEANTSGKSERLQPTVS